MRQFKVVIMGAGGVGKTSMATQFIEKRFNENYEPTVEDIYKTQMTVDGESCMLELYDTAGMDQFTHLRDGYIKKSDGFILVYSVSDPTTFEDVKSIRAQIVRARYSEQIPMVLVGNKRDLNDIDRAVEIGVGENLASKWPNCQFLETSAKDHEDIEQVFLIVARQILSFDEIKKGRVSILVEEAQTKKKESGKCAVM